MTLNLKDWVLCNLSDSHRFPRCFSNWNLHFGAMLWNLWLPGGTDLLLTIATIGWTSPRWLKPPDPFIKANTDGGKSSALGRSFCGGVARNSAEDWCFGFAKFIGVCSVLDVEVWGAYLGLSLAWEKGFQLVILELDSVAIAGVVRKDYNGYHNFCGHFVELWCRPWHVKVVLVKRQRNQVADTCAKLVNCNTLDIIHFDRPPASVSHLLQLDLSADR
ncbi:hypothetical protein V6N11_034106 [Hibiscus sabdariffa]|uniref:RNase H type-1 domain-containing protein n=1 Tax=Hibiscus sabdariffa TaxID=183260 RepID=A0ABR2S1P6_9ROSI